MPGLENQIALVTGASRGIGKATVAALIAEGAKVVATARSADALAALADQFGDSVVGVPGDASSESDVEAVVKAGLDAFGRIDILVNNAGIGILGALAETSIEDFDRQVATNVRSVFLYCHAVIPVLEGQGGGKIVNIASISGLKGFGGASVYVATKFATIGLSRSLDIELREKNIKVTAICPAGVDTDWAIGTGLTREGVAGLDRLAPSTIADAVVYAVKQPANARVTELVIYPMIEQGHQ
jgi:3-oxoacyl-[acyl-carrier protein] reductase